VFDLTKEVPRLDLCQQLKRLGFPQETGGFYWRKFKDGWKVDYIPYISVVKRMVRQGVIIKAPTSVELDKYLPCFIYKGKDKYFKQYDTPDDTQNLLSYVNSDTGKCLITLADVYKPNLDAKMLVYLITRRYINLKELSDDNSD